MLSWLREWPRALKEYHLDFKKAPGQLATAQTDPWRRNENPTERKTAKRWNLSGEVPLKKRLKSIVASDVQRMYAGCSGPEFDSYH